MKAAIYARVSTTDQVKGTSLDGQVESCRDYAQRNGYTVVKEIREDMSGARLHRPGLNEIRTMAERSEIQAVVVSEPDRLSRSLGHTAILTDEFSRHKVELIFVAGPDRNTPEGRLFFNMGEVFKEWEREKILERTTRGRVRAANAGKVICSARSAPYGYAYKDAAFEIVPSEAVWVDRMFSWVVFGRCSMSEVRRRLEAANVPTRRGSKYWYQSTIQQILSNSGYYGMWYWNKRESSFAKRHNSTQPTKHEKTTMSFKPREQWIAIPIPAIITQDVYESAQIQLTRNKDMARRNCKLPYLLRGLLFCKQCGRRLAGMSSNTKNTKYRFYHCTSRQRPDLRANCRCKYLNADKLETRLWEELIKRLGNKEVIYDILNNYDHARADEQVRDDADMNALIATERKLKAEEDRLLTAYEAEAIDLTQLKERQATKWKAREELEKTKTEILARTQQRGFVKGQRETIENLVALVQQGLHLFTYDDKREYLEALEIRGTVDGDTTLFTGLISGILLNLSEKEHTDADDTTCIAYTLSSASSSISFIYKTFAWQ